MTWRSEARLVRNKSAVSRHSHRQQCHMPAAGDKAAASGRACVLLLTVKWLGVPHFGELNDLLARDYNLPEVEDFAHSVFLGALWRLLGHADRRVIERSVSGADPVQPILYYHQHKSAQKRR